MSFSYAIRTLALACALAISSSLHFAAAQALNAEHMEAARKMLQVTRFTDRFDLILPDASLALKRQLSDNNPDKADEIDAIVDEEALALAVRRGALEDEAARLVATVFSLSELEEMNLFFTSDAGKKYLSGMPNVILQMDEAAQIWSGGIRRDLTQNVIRRINEITQ